MNDRSGEKRQIVDLEIVVEEERFQGTTRFLYTLRAPDAAVGVNNESYESAWLRRDPSKFFEEFFETMGSLSGAGSEDRKILVKRLELRSLGLAKNLLPNALRARLWSLRSKVRTVLVQSTEPWIPWELLRIADGGDGVFLCEAFAMTRWLPGLPVRLKLPLVKCALVAPSGSGLWRSKKEVDFILDLSSEEREVHRVAARYVEVLQTLEDDGYDAWHFTGHGIMGTNGPEHWGLELDEYEQIELADLAGLKFRESCPLVFLNCCHSGRTEWSLTGAAGWARSFVEAGAGAFIGSYWPIDDGAAATFAKRFYRELLGGRPFGEAFWQARAALRQAYPEDGTWLAYTAYAHPLASLPEPEPSDDSIVVIEPEVVPELEDPVFAMDPILAMLPSLAPSNAWRLSAFMYLVLVLAALGSVLAQRAVRSRDVDVPEVYFVIGPDGTEDLGFAKASPESAEDSAETGEE